MRFKSIAIVWTVVQLSFWAAGSFAGPVTTGRVGYWEFEGNASDSTGAHVGVENGTIEYVTTQFGQSAYFNGNDYITVSDHPDFNFTNGFSVVLWINPSSTSLYHGAGLVSQWDWQSNQRSHVLGIGRQAWAPQSGLNNAFIATGSGAGEVWGISNDNAITPDTWQQLAFTYDQTGTPTMRLYINQTLVIETNAITSLYDSVDDIYIGAVQDTISSTSYNGYIDELEIFSRALSFEEITTVYNYVANGKQSTIPEPTSLLFSLLASVVLWIRKRSWK